MYDVFKLPFPVCDTPTLKHLKHLYSKFETLLLLTLQIGFGMYPVVVKMFADSENSSANPLIFSFYR